MKLLKDNEFISRKKVKQLFLATSIMVLGLYIIAMICSLSGVDYFIVKYQNSQMDKIELWFRERGIYSMLMFAFSTLEFYIGLCFVLRKKAHWIYPLLFYGIRVALAFIVRLPSIFNTVYPFIFYLLIPIVDQLIENKNSDYHKKFEWHKYLKHVIRVLIVAGVTLLLQILLYAIKDGYFSNDNHVMNLSATFIYALEYDIALFVLLTTITLYISREKGDSTVWTTYQVHGGSSQITKTSSQKLSSRKMTLTKTQRSRLTRFWVILYLHQLLGFLLLMILPFIMGKVLEFLTMYLAFAIARYILGFKYSLHFKKESTCITVGIIVFGILTLAVPFFYAIMIIAVAYGVGLAFLLHLSYKYKGMWLFSKISKPDKFALLYTYFDGNLEYNHVRRICKLKGLEPKEVDMVSDYTQGYKMTYLAKVYNYSLRMMNYKLDECIEKLLAKA